MLTITSLTTYLMQKAKLARSLCDEFDRNTRKFIWGGNEERRGNHLISRKNLQKPLDKGGIGIRSPRQANATVLTKLGWRVLIEPDVLWSRVLRYKYCRGHCYVVMFTPKVGM